MEQKELIWQGMSRENEHEGWQTRYIRDFLTHFSSDPFYSQEEKLALFNQAIVSLKNKTPEMHRCHNAQAVMDLLPAEERYKVILELKKTLSRKGEATLTSLMQQIR